MSLLSSLTAIRYYTSADPYYYTVDNRPLTDVDTSLTTIATFIDSFVTVASGTVTIASTSNGDILLSPNGTGDIKWGKANIALGGGAGATLGTIGGSGPASAAQNSWIRAKDSTGANIWIAVWK
jgi:hypothetical protein